MTKDYEIIQPDNLNSVFEYLDSREDLLICMDLETDSKHEHKATNIGIGVTCEVNKGLYVPIWKWVKISDLNKMCASDWRYKQRIREDETGALVRILTKEQEDYFVIKISEYFNARGIIGHNLVYDVAVWQWNYNINLTECVESDTILQKHSISEDRPFGLKDLAVRYQKQIGIPEDELANQEQLELKESVKRNGGRWTRSEKDIYKADMEIVGKYCCADVDLTIRLFDHFENILEKRGLVDFFYHKEVMPLYRSATIPMKLGGLRIDVEYFKNLKNELECDIMNLINEVFEHILDDVQPLVAQILDKKVLKTRKGKFAEELLNYYSLEVPRTPSGKPSLAKKNLQHLDALYPNHTAVSWLRYEPILATPLIEVDIPIYDSEGNVTSTKKGWDQKQKPVRVYDVDPEEPYISPETILEIKKKNFLENNPKLPHVFNLNSKDHLSWLLFECYHLKPKSYSRKTKKPQVNKDSLEEYKDEHEFIPTLMKLFKDEKILSTYVNPVLHLHNDGWLYPSMLQFGTTSGRYSCGGGSINFQTLPRDDMRIKKGFIAPPGYKFVNADFSSLEPRCFAWTSNDAGLKAVYQKGLDLYSQIAIDVFNLKGVSAKESDDNYLKKVNPEYRQKVKQFALAVPYGAEAGRVSSMLGCKYWEASQIINKYLDMYPDLKEYMSTTEREARTKGYVNTKFGRTRHLPEARELYSKYGDLLNNKMLMAITVGGARAEEANEQYLKYKNSRNPEDKAKAMKFKNKVLEIGEIGVAIYFRYRNLINNSRNFPIQSTAAHITNAAMIKLSKLMEENKIDGWVCLQIHDEIATIVKEDQVELMTKLLQDAMENNDVTARIDIPILADPVVGNNLAEAK